MHWYDEFDIGLKNGHWADPGVDDSSWKTVQIPGGFKELGVADVPSLGWFRREITLPDPLPPGKARVYLGAGREDGHGLRQRPAGRRQFLGREPARLFARPACLKPGRNVIAMRVFKLKPDGGFLGKPDELRLALGDGTVIPLAGEWKGNVSVDAPPAASAAARLEN